ncbi:MAG: site-2 protease family protein [Nitrospirae bacterium]|nr:site-2 protease family protein [Nitrospirota bacterium]
MGRLTLNPIAHIDLMGTVIVPILLFVGSNGAFIFGSAKPVPVNFGNLRNPRRDMALVALAGPVMNIILSICSVFLFAFVRALYNSTQDEFFSAKVLVPISHMLSYSLSFNIFIAAFNLIPIPPLDGGRVLVSMLPYRYAYQIARLEPYGTFIILGLWFLGLLSFIVTPIQVLIQLFVEIFVEQLGRFM